MGATEMANSVVSMQLIGLVSVAVLSTGCLVGPNYMRPEMPTPQQFRFVEGAQAESLADAPWFKVFDDPALQALIKDAIANNLDLRAAVARVEEMRARAGIAKSFLYPQVDGVANYSVRGATSAQSDDDGDEEDTLHQSGSYGFQLSWELDLFGKLRRQHEAALAVALASEQARRGVMVTLVGDVASSYFLLRELDIQLFIARQTLDINNQTVQYFQNRLDGGVSNRLEVDRIRALRSETAVAIPEIEQQMAIVEHAISLLLGRPPGPWSQADVSRLPRSSRQSTAVSSVSPWHRLGRDRCPRSATSASPAGCAPPASSGFDRTWSLQAEGAGVAPIRS